MLKRLMKVSLYGAPALVVLTAFGAGHMLVAPKTDRLKTYRLDHGLIAPEPDPEPVATEATPTDQPPPETTPDGQILKPGYRYFSFMMPFTGNLGDTRRLYSMELSLSVFDTPFKAESMTVKLTDMEAQVRSYVVDALEGVTEEQLRDKDSRDALAAAICAALNAAFKTLGEDITLKSAVITNLVFT